MEKGSATNKQIDEDYHKAVKLIEEATACEDPYAFFGRWDESWKLAERCLNYAPRSARFNYLCGYILYRAPNKAKETWQEAERLLNQALKLEPRHLFARYHLVCVLFDQKRFGEALAQLDCLPSGAFAANGQGWRDLKVKEVRLACEFYLRPNEVQPAEACELFDAYKTMDPSLAPLPAEFATCLHTYLENNPTPNPNVRQLCHTCTQILRWVRMEHLINDRWRLLSRFAA